MEEKDGFYEKLNKVNESSGLSLLFNFRDTNMDLYRFYKMVIERGGYHQVTKGRIWEDVGSSLNSENEIQWATTQLQNLYANILYPFEQTYHYRTPAKPHKTPMTPDLPLESEIFLTGDSNCSAGKRKHGDRYYPTQSDFSDRDNSSKKIEYNHNCRQPVSGQSAARVEEKKPVLETPAKVKEARKDPWAPLGSRNCYQMFIKMECDRLKRIHGDSPSAQLRDMVVEAWRHLSNDDKQPYVKASKKDKERFAREMAAYEEHKRKQQKKTLIADQKLVNFSSPRLIDFTTPSREAAGGSHMIPCEDFAKPCCMRTDGDYHVALQPDDGDEIARASDESTVQMAVGLMKNARPNDPIFQINWEEYHGSLDVTPG